MAQRMGRSKDRLTKPSKFMMNQKSTEKLSRNQSSNYLQPKTLSFMAQSKTFSNQSDLYDITLNSNDTFKPIINAKSRQIDREVSRSPLNRFEQLYQQKDHQNAKKNALSTLYDQEDMLKDIENCTFTPRINTHYSQFTNLEGGTNVVERNKQWQR